MKIRVLIAEDDQSIRKWYAYSLGSMEDIELLPMAENGYQAVASAVLYHPDVLILDMEMESRDAGLKAGQQVLSILPETKIIMLTVYDDDATIFRAYEMGAVDYLFKNASTEKIHEAILDAYRGTSPIRQEIVQRMRQEFRRLKRNEMSLHQIVRVLRQLSGTESAIVVMLAQGMTRKEICEKRFIEMSTLKSHIRNILQKMGVKSTAELMELVNQENLLSYLQGGDNADEQPPEEE